MASTNEITGDSIVSKKSSYAYSSGWDAIWGKKEEPKSYNPSIILSNKIQCVRCGDIIESKHTNDYVTCTCGAVAIDGGKNPYSMRRIGNPEDYTDLSEITSEEDEDWFERVRETFTWNSYGKNAKGPKKEILLKNLEKDHIKAILETQWHIRGSYVEEYLKKELEYRDAL